MVKFVSLRINQSPAGTGVDYTERITKNILDPYIKQVHTTRCVGTAFSTDPNFYKTSLRES